MPTAPLKPCAHAGCPELVTGRSRCDAHTKARRQLDDSARPSAAARGYGAKWQRYREQYLRANPLCGFCSRRGVVAAATVVDHIVPHRGDQKLFWRTSNHQALCTTCHNVEKQRIERAGTRSVVPATEGGAKSLGPSKV